MADFPATTLILGLAVVLANYYTLKFYPRIIYVVFSLSFLLITGVGYYLATTAPNKALFEMLVILSMFASAFSVLWMVLEVARDAFKVMANRRM